jgi:large subunit ribosomal protein L24
MKDKPVEIKKIRKGDKVIAIAGNDRGQSGVVLKLVGEKVLVQGLNMRKKHVKRSENNQQGGIIDIEVPIHISNVSACTADERPVKLRVRVNKAGERELYYKLDGHDVLFRSVKKLNARS